MPIKSLMLSQKKKKKLSWLCWLLTLCSYCSDSNPCCLCQDVQQVKGGEWEAGGCWKKEIRERSHEGKGSKQHAFQERWRSVDT